MSRRGFMVRDMLRMHRLDALVAEFVDLHPGWQMTREGLARSFLFAALEDHRLVRQVLGRCTAKQGGHKSPAAGNYIRNIIYPACP